jgi:hypothetical protein
METPMTSDTPVPASDRDPELAAALAVPALDGPTRRALVDTALARADDRVDDDAEAPELVPDLPQHRRNRMTAALGLAAAIEVGALVGVAIVNQPGDRGPHQAAAPSTAAEDQARAAPSPGELESVAEAPAGSSAPPVDLGDLGPVAGADGLRAAINARFEAGTGSAPASVPCATSSSGATSGIYGLVAITAAGTANLDGSDVVVLIGPTPEGANVGVVLDPSRGCEFIRIVRL